MRCVRAGSILWSRPPACTPRPVAPSRGPRLGRRVSSWCWTSADPHWSQATMRTSTMQRNVADFGMDTISLAGPLEAKLAAVKAAGFGQIMLAARDIVGHPQGIEAAVHTVRSSGLRVTGFQVLRDFEGLSGHLHSYKVDIAKQMILMA